MPVAQNDVADVADADAVHQHIGRRHQFFEHVTMPALVIRHEGLQYVTAEMTRDLVATLPNARLVVLPGLWADDPERLADRIIAFVDDQD